LIPLFQQARHGKWLRRRVSEGQELPDPLLGVASHGELPGALHPCPPPPRPV